MLDGALLGSCVIDLSNKDSLMKLGKEQLVDIIVNYTKNQEEFIKNLLSLDEKALIEYQKDIRFMFGLMKLFGVEQ